MGANRRIDPAAGPLGLQHRLVQRLAHAVQALEFETVTVPGKLQDGRHGVSVVGGELRVDPIGHRQELFRAGDIGDIGGGFSGKYRKMRKTQRLRPLDFGIPVSPLDQADHQPAIEPGGKRVEPVDDMGRPRSIGLNDHAETIPAVQGRIAQERFDHIEGKIEAVGFLGIDVEPHARRFREQSE